MLDPEEADSVRQRFGVDDRQVQRDHLVSLLLAALSVHARDDLVFFGGTALARTHLPHVRLSEDLDLLAVGERAALARRLEPVLASSVRRGYGQLRWLPPLSSTTDVESASLVAEDGLAVRIQLLAGTSYAPWPTEMRTLIQRYSDAPPARLRVPTLPAFAAWKTATWADRGLPRDLYDLWALAELGAIDVRARELYVAHGPTGSPPAQWLFDRPPGTGEWRVHLGGQTRIAVEPAEAADRVRAAWQRVG